MFNFDVKHFILSLTQIFDELHACFNHDNLKGQLMDIERLEQSQIPH